MRPVAKFRSTPGSNAITCGRKFCSGCGRWRQVLDFSCHKREPLRLHSKCRSCSAAYLREWHAAHPEKSREYDQHWRERLSPEQLAYFREKGRLYAERQRKDPRTALIVKERNRLEWQAMRADPVRWAQRLETQRLNYRMRAERAGRPIPPVAPKTYVKRYGTDAGKKAALPVEPLIDRLRRDAVYLKPADQRRAYAILHGENRQITLTVADRLCAALNVPLALVYPEVSA